MQRFVWNYLWVAPHLLQAGVAMVMIVRRLYRSFPIFFLYTGFEVLQFSLLYATYHLPELVSNQAYSEIYWAGLFGSTALRFAVIYEIFTRVFRSYPALQELGILLFRWATVVLLLVAVATAAYSPGNDTQRMFEGFTLVDRAVSLVQCGLVLFLFLFSGYFGLSWRNYVFGIALGLGIFASVDLAAAAIQAEVGPSTSGTFDLITMATYHCSVLIWLFYLLAPERAPVRLKEVPSHNLQEWNHALERLLQQ